MIIAAIKRISPRQREDEEPRLTIKYFWIYKNLPLSGGWYVFGVWTVENGESNFIRPDRNFGAVNRLNTKLFTFIKP